MAYYVGLMSGTSMDGIDAALIDMPSHRLIHAITLKYSLEVECQLSQLLKSQHSDLASLCQLNTLIGREFALAVNQLLDEANVTRDQVVAIGSHGQTVCHDATSSIPYTLQIGCPHTIATHTGIQVVADFRTRDVVKGGHGAPFAPLYHQEIFSALGEDIAVVNIGGIANISLISGKRPTRGWDVGPGNCLMDAWIKDKQGLDYDRDGAWANQGHVITGLLENLLEDPFFSQPPPKSIGKEYFSLEWLNRHIKKEYLGQDIMSTLAQLTAEGIALSINNESQAISKLYLCGGGAHNLSIKQRLSTLLSSILVRSSADVNLSPDYIEAMMFAWFAYRAVHRLPVNLSTITGSKGEMLLGALYPV